MVAPVCALAFMQSAPPKNMDQLMDFIQRAYERAKGYSDKWQMEADGSNKVTYERTLDAPRIRFNILADNQPYILFGSDGKTDFSVLYPAKAYYQEATPKSDNKGSKPATEQQTFKFAIESTSIDLACDPPLKIVSIKPDTVDGKPVRRLIAQAVNPKTGGRAEAVLLFLPDAWIPTDIRVTIFPKGEASQSVMHSWGEIKTGQKFGPEVFTLDQASVKDFTKTSRDALTKMLGG